MDLLPEKLFTSLVIGILTLKEFLAADDVTNIEEPMVSMRPPSNPPDNIRPATRSPVAATKSQLVMGLGLGFGFTFGLIVTTIIVWKICCHLMSPKLANPRNQVTPRSDEENNAGRSNANVGGDDIDFSSFERE